MQSKVSVIVPVYNREKQIERCIKSILEQTYASFELILVDDGSKDASLSICKQYESQQVIVIHQENGGVSKARNTGLAHAAGEYIAFVDSDDFIAPTYLYSLVTFMESHDVDLVVSNESSLAGVMEQDYIATGQEEIKKSIAAYYHKCPINSVWGKLYKKALITDLYDTSLSMGEDFLFNLQYLPNCKAVAYTTIAQYTMPVDTNNSLSRSYISGEFVMCSKVQKALNDYIGIYTSRELQMRLLGIAKSCIYKIANNANLNRNEKKNAVREILNDSYFIEINASLTDLSMKDKLLLMLIQRKWVSCVLLLFQKKR